MGRLFAIDYGKKRVGIAVSDELKMIANPLTTVETYKIFDYIAEYLKTNPVESFVVGQPFDMHGNPSEATQYIEPFVVKLGNLYPSIPIFRVDERFTSKLAFDAILTTVPKKSKRRDKSLVDKLSATIILESFMDNPSFYMNKK